MRSKIMDELFKEAQESREDVVAVQQKKLELKPIDTIPSDKFVIIYARYLNPSRHWAKGFCFTAKRINGRLLNAVGLEIKRQIAVWEPKGWMDHPEF